MVNTNDCKPCGEYRIVEVEGFWVVNLLNKKIITRIVSYNTHTIKYVLDRTYGLCVRICKMD